MAKNNNFNLEKKYIKAQRRETKKSKRKYAPRGGTLAAQVKRAQGSRFYIRSKKRSKIRIVDKTRR